MAIKIAPPEPELSNIRKHLLTPRPFRRVLGWGGAATFALAAVALTSQTETGSKRLQLAIAYMSEPVRAVAQIPPSANETKAETQRLALQVRELAADRERLTARIATLEHNIEDMTGSIKQQTTQLAAARAAMPGPPQPSIPATTVASVSAPPSPKPALPALTPIAPKIAAVIVPEEPQPPAAENKIQDVPLPPVRNATAASEPTAAPPPAKVEYGIDLGAASTLEALRMQWVTVKANYGPLLAGLHPLATEHAKHPTGVIYRLVAGPLPNAVEATQLCARFPVTRTGCRPTKFVGVQLVPPI